MEMLCTKIVDGVHKTPDYVDHGIPFVTIENLTAGEGIDFQNARRISYSQHINLCKRIHPKPNDILVTKDGTLGISRIVPETAPEFSIFVSVALLRPDLNIVTPQFIKLFFETNSFVKQLGTLSAGTGLKHIHLEHFRAFNSFIPSIEEQYRIGERIESINKQIASLKAEIQKFSCIKQGLMQDLLSGQVRVV